MFRFSIAVRGSRTQAAASLLALASIAPALGQQVLQRGPLGAPSQIYDETQQWTSALPVVGDAEEDVYIPDVSNTAWLDRNYADYENKGVYTITMVTQYKRGAACRRDQVRWGASDAAHLDACTNINYRLREVSIDVTQKTVSLIFAAMVGEDGQLIQDPGPAQSITRRWADLDPLGVQAIAKTNDIVANQMRIYDRKMRGIH